MGEQRQPFRFRLPWSAAPAPVAPRQQRPPFRPGGVGPTQPPPPPPPTQPPTRVAEPPRVDTTPSSAPPGSQPRSPSRVTPPPTPPRPTSQSRVATPSRAPPASPSPSSSPSPSPSRGASRTQVTSQRASPEPKPKPQAAGLPPSPSRVGTQTALPRASPTPPPTPSRGAQRPQPEAEARSSPRKPPVTTTTATTKEISQPQLESIKQENFQPQVTTTPPEKVVESLGSQTEVSGPKPESKEQAIKEVHQRPSKEPIEMLKAIHHEPNGHEERGEHPNEEVFDRKEVLKRFRSGGHNSETEIRGHERPVKFHENREMGGGDSTKSVHKLGGGRDKHSMHDKPVSVITLTGENTGASMHLTSESLKRERSIRIHRGYKINPNENIETTDGEESSNGKKSGDTKHEEELATKLYVNNNAQGINNSLVFESSVTERNPGVHLMVSRNSVQPASNVGKESETLDSRKAEVATTQADRLAYAPNIRRRCLRGLFLESSDSDPDNPDKPRRHGCLVGRRQKGKDDTSDAL